MHQGVVQVAKDLTTHVWCFAVPLGGLLSVGKNIRVIYKTSFIVSNVVGNAHMEPLRENQSDKPRLLVAQPRAPAGRRAHATNTRLYCIGFCGSPSCHVDFGPSAVKEKSSKILLISYDKNWAPPLITYSIRNMAIDVGAFSSSCINSLVWAR